MNRFLAIALLVTFVAIVDQASSAPKAEPKPFDQKQMEKISAVIQQKIKEGVELPTNVLEGFTKLMKGGKGAKNGDVLSLLGGFMKRKGGKGGGPLADLAGLFSG